MRNNEPLYHSIMNNEYFKLKPDEDGFNAMVDSYYCRYRSIGESVNTRLERKFLFETRDLEPELNIDNSDRAYEHSLIKGKGNPVCIHNIYGDLIEHYRLDGTKVFSLKNWFIRLYRTVKGLFKYEQ